ncbi:MAG: YggT family protein [Bacillota bacterium]|nr:YggT family protein [Bacillota bacterium]
MKIVDTALWVYVISSWLVNLHPTIWKINRFLGGFFEPLLAPIRKLLMPITMRIGLDFSVYVFAILLSWVMNLAYNIVYAIL